MSMLRIILLVLGVLAAIPALLMSIAGVLGLIGILADIGPAENRKFGLQALTYAAPFAAISLLFIAASFFAKTNRQPK